jgi:SAM-dependent MidA family methyltransferase
MSAACHEIIVREIRDRGPITVARFMALALYHPDHGYYSTAPLRSGRAGDFFTSVDVGPVFGELLAVQFSEMWRLLRDASGPEPPGTGGTLDLVEAGAGNGRLARDILDAAAARHPAFYNSVRLHLVEASGAARSVHAASLGPHAGLLASSGVELPPAVEGVIYANELLDAMPVHVVSMTGRGLREVCVDIEDGRLIERLLPPSTPALEGYFDRLGVRLLPGWRAEVNLAAIDWVNAAAGCLRRGFLVLVDYGHEAPQLYSQRHSAGTLATFSRHTTEPAAGAGGPRWLAAPGTHDITSHVDLTSVRSAAEAADFETLCATDQMYFLLGLGLAGLAAERPGNTIEEIKRRLALKTLMMPGGLGSTHKVLVFGKAVGRPLLSGCAGNSRLT